MRAATARLYRRWISCTPDRPERSTGRGPSISRLPALRLALQRADRASGVRFRDQRGEPLRPRLLLLRADHPPGRRPAVPGRARLEVLPRSRIGAEVPLHRRVEGDLVLLLEG